MEDREIVELYWRRDSGAIEETQAKYDGFLRALAERFVSPEDAEECVLDTYLRAWNAIPPERPASLRGFLARLTRNLALDRLRRDRAAKRGGGEAGIVAGELEAVAPDSALENVTAQELGRYVNDFVRSLPRREGDILIRRCFFAEPVKDIAARYGMTPNAVSVSLNRSRRKLADHLKKEGLL